MEFNYFVIFLLKITFRYLEEFKSTFIVLEKEK